MEKRVVVTGGCGGLGSQLVRSHLASGDIVYAYDMKITSEMTELKQKYDTLHLAECDASSYESVSRAFEEMKINETRVDFLYHTIGIYRFADKAYLTEVELDDMGLMININAIGFLRVMKTMWDYFQDSAVICITSEAGSIGSNWRSWEYEYCMSKCAENMAATIVQHHFKELGKNTRIICIHPGWLRTKMGGEDAFKHPEMSVDPADSAAGIRDIAENINSFPEDVAFMDYSKKVLRW